MILSALSRVVGKSMGTGTYGTHGNPSMFGSEGKHQIHKGGSAHLILGACILYFRTTKLNFKITLGWTTCFISAITLQLGSSV